MSNKLLSKTFFYMAIGLLISFGAAYFTATNDTMLNFVFGNSYSYLILSIIEIVLVIFLSARALKMDKTTATLAFGAYSLISGITMAAIFIVYEIGSIINIFLLASVVFAIFALIGWFSKIDLSKIGTFLVIALIVALVISIINMFIGNITLDIWLTFIILLVMVGFVAYDLQKIKRLAIMNIESDALSIVMALSLYLDFVNIFLRLLRLFGKSRN